MSNTRKSSFLFIILLTAFTIGSFAQPGTLDNSFGTHGKITTSIGEGISEAYSVTIQSDGKIIAGGYSINGLPTGEDFALIRYNTNGSLDTTFGIGGKVITDFNLTSDWLKALAVQDDGKILATGFTSDNFSSSFGLCRYNTNGSLDSTFGNNGKVITDVGNGAAQAIAIQSDGKIIVAGSTIEYGSVFVVVRYNIDGGVDSSFHMPPEADANLGFSDRAWAMTLQHDGKIVVAGYSITAPDEDQDFGLIRLQNNGAFDSSFNKNGKVTTSVGHGKDYALAVATQSDSKIVAAGYTTYPEQDSFALVRYNYDGTLDSSFGSGGKVTSATGTGNNQAHALVIQRDGKIIAVGYAMDGDYNKFALARFNSDGTPDLSFGNYGWVTTAVDSLDNLAYSVLIQADQKIVVGGNASNSMHDNFAIVRYLNELSLGILNFSNSQSSLFIYPNPIQQTEQLGYTLTQDEILTLSLYDVNGRVMKNFFTHEKRIAGEQKEELNIGNIPAGNYFLTLGNGTQKVSVKMVKQ